MFGFIGAHTTQSPPGAGILGTRRLCVASARACTLHRGAAVAQGPERGAFYLRAGLKYGRGGTFQGGLFLYAYLGFNLFHQLPIEPAISRSAHDVPHSSRRYMAQRRQTFGHIQDPTKKYTLTTNQEVALYAF